MSDHEAFTAVVVRVGRDRDGDVQACVGYQRFRSRRFSDPEYAGCHCGLPSIDLSEARALNCTTGPTLGR